MHNEKERNNKNKMI